jgi:hypothetical protein
MTINKRPNRMHTFSALGQSGSRADIEQLMNELTTRNDVVTTKLVDNALSQVTSREGIATLRHYLFHGDQTQRNYAALFFKRKGHHDLLHEAFNQGMIDHKQAYLK